MRKLRLFLAALILLSLSAPAAPGQTKIDEYGVVNSDEEAARIDSFLARLVESPSAKGCFVIYKPRNWGVGRFLRRFEGIKNYVSARGDGAEKSHFMERIVFAAGPEKDELWNELWLVPGGGKAPGCETVSPEKKLGEKVRGKTLFDSVCIGCSPTVDLNLRLPDGLTFYAEALKANPEPRALLIIGKTEFLSGTRRERRKLTAEILDVLVRKNRVRRNRISIRFADSDFAELYIVPGKNH